MIVVLPDSRTAHNGSMYSSSVTTGDFERFVSHDVVAWVDAHYRTIPDRTSRGLTGHSMGGYGAARIGMKHPDVFGSLYIMSPCCLAPRGTGPGPPTADLEKEVAAMKAPTDSASLSFFPRAPGPRTRPTRRCTSSCRRRMGRRGPTSWRSGALAQRLDRLETAAPGPTARPHRRARRPFTPLRRWDRSSARRSETPAAPLPSIIASAVIGSTAVTGEPRKSFPLRVTMRSQAAASAAAAHTASSKSRRSRSRARRTTASSTVATRKTLVTSVTMLRAEAAVLASATRYHRVARACAGSTPRTFPVSTAAQSR